VSKLHWAAEDVFSLPGMPDDVQYAAIDEDGDKYLYTQIPECKVVYNDHRDFRCGVWIAKLASRAYCLDLLTDYEGDWRDSLLVRE
jgi:hypothetical protein